MHIQYVIIPKSLLVCLPHPRCPGGYTDPQRLAALHCLQVYLGNDPKLELKVQEAGMLFARVVLIFVTCSSLIDSTGVRLELKGRKKERMPRRWNSKTERATLNFSF